MCNNRLSLIFHFAVGKSPCSLVEINQHFYRRRQSGSSSAMSAIIKLSSAIKTLSLADIKDSTAVLSIFVRDRRRIAWKKEEALSSRIKALLAVKQSNEHHCRNNSADIGDVAYPAAHRNQEKTNREHCHANDAASYQRHFSSPIPRGGSREDRRPRRLRRDFEDWPAIATASESTHFQSGSARSKVVASSFEKSDVVLAIGAPQYQLTTRRHLSLPPLKTLQIT
jgi:hypothetical protein